MLGFTDKVAVITGGSRGIGAATAKLFASLGSDVVINYLTNSEHAEEIKSDIEKMGRQCVTAKADMGKRADCEKLIDTAIDQFGKIDILINNAGIWNEAAIENMTDEKLDTLLDINLKGCFYTSTAAVPHMKKAKIGKYHIYCLNRSSTWRGLALPLRGVERSLGFTYQVAMFRVG
jgi:NAD(P)-dependent dehydrogenase (short-subunit alcohol dehydrogenase family)